MIQPSPVVIRILSCASGVPSFRLLFPVRSLGVGVRLRSLARSAPHFCRTVLAKLCCACEVHGGRGVVGAACEVRTLLLLCHAGKVVLCL